MVVSDVKSPESLWSVYWAESARPLVSLVFVAPMLAAYESGLVLLGPQAMRNGADLWLRWWLEGIGLGQYFLLPLIICCGLLAWHHLRGEPWRVQPVVLSGMLLESVVLSLMLLMLARLQGAILACASAAGEAAGAPTASGLDHALAFLGAGIYEELLFRWLLLPVLAGVLGYVGFSRPAGLSVAVLLGSLLFAAAHYRIDILVGSHHVVTTIGDAFEWTSFLFRFVAGLFFSGVFLCRGFGIAAGTHALYDILVFFL